MDELLELDKQVLHMKPQPKIIPVPPAILSTSTDCSPCSRLAVHASSLLSCSLLMYRFSVQQRKACLLRWRVSKKGSEAVRCPSHPVLQFSQQNNRSPFPCSVRSPSRRAAFHVSCHVTSLVILIFIIIWEKLLSRAAIALIRTSFI